jgi:hypothetical protein
MSLRQSASSPAVSTPEKPPPITTKCPTAADGRIGLELDLRDAAQHHVADVHRVADRLERQSVLGESRDQVEPCTIAEGQYEMLEVQRDLAGEVAASRSCVSESIALTRPMMNRVRASICRMGATTCSGKIDAPSASAASD